MLRCTNLWCENSNDGLEMKSSYMVGYSKLKVYNGPKALCFKIVRRFEDIMLGIAWVGVYLREGSPPWVRWEGPTFSPSHME